MIRNRFHTPARLCSILAIARGASVEVPIITSNPTMVEILDQGDPSVVFRNFPSQSFPTAERDPLRIITLLAYDAFDWQAREIMKRYNYSHFSDLQRQWADKSGVYYARAAA